LTLTIQNNPSQDRIKVIDQNGRLSYTTTGTVTGISLSGSADEFTLLATIDGYEFDAHAETFSSSPTANKVDATFSVTATASATKTNFACSVNVSPLPFVSGLLVQAGAVSDASFPPGYSVTSVRASYLAYTIPGYTPTNKGVTSTSSLTGANQSVTGNSIPLVANGGSDYALSAAAGIIETGGSPVGTTMKFSFQATTTVPNAVVVPAASSPPAAPGPTVNNPAAAPASSNIQTPFLLPLAPLQTDLFALAGFSSLATVSDILFSNTNAFALTTNLTPVVEALLASQLVGGSGASQTTQAEAETSTQPAALASVLALDNASAASIRLAAFVGPSAGGTTGSGSGEVDPLTPIEKRAVRTGSSLTEADENIAVIELLVGTEDVPAAGSGTRVAIAEPPAASRSEGQAADPEGVTVSTEGPVNRISWSLVVVVGAVVVVAGSWPWYGKVIISPLGHLVTGVRRLGTSLLALVTGKARGA
jgi:hypothetical protein